MSSTPIDSDRLHGKSDDGTPSFARSTLAMHTEDNIELDMIMDVPVTLAMEFGRTQISIKRLLQLQQGSIVELDRLASEPLDIYVNGTLVARGEVVVVNDKFGIRLTDIISLSERIKKLA